MYSNVVCGGTVAAGLFVIMAGCGRVGPDYSKVDLADVRGEVTLDGQPLVDAVVVFEAPDTTYSFGRTDSAGAYQLMFNSEKSGVTPGPKIVRIRTSGGLGEMSEEGAEDAEGSAKEPEQVPACYNSKSQLKATVESGAHSIDFHLKSDCSVTSPAT